jgi:predicted alpha/beta-hydrolase family hydrolase
MTSQAEALSPLGVKGLAFLGFPLHAAGQPSDARAAHLFDARVPMLFVQGTRDALADLSLMRALTKKLGARATLHLVDDADHSFHVPAKSGRKDAEVRRAFLDGFTAWVTAL